MKSMLRSLFVVLLFLLPFSSIASADDCVCALPMCPDCGQGGGGGGGGSWPCAVGEDPADGCTPPGQTSRPQPPPPPPPPSQQPH